MSILLTTAARAVAFQPSGLCRYQKRKRRFLHHCHQHLPPYEPEEAKKCRTSVITVIRVHRLATVSQVLKPSSEKPAGPPPAAHGSTGIELTFPATRPSRTIPSLKSDIRVTSGADTVGREIQPTGFIWV
ncbi:hypothetical protein GOODEAATRI_006788 [Goodea atripinnis]|uniref:Uncharacterized protein n=1 Tax=Goodea atripinnis TaxID=208336 RepID=A0ABV0PVY1_9TELE